MSQLCFFLNESNHRRLQSEIFTLFFVRKSSCLHTETALLERWVLIRYQGHKQVFKCCSINHGDPCVILPKDLMVLSHLQDLVCLN